MILSESMRVTENVDVIRKIICDFCNLPIDSENIGKNANFFGICEDYFSVSLTRDNNGDFESFHGEVCLKCFEQKFKKVLRKTEELKDKNYL